MEEVFQTLYLWFDDTQKSYTVFVTDTGSYLKATTTSTVQNIASKGIYSDDFYMGKHNCKKVNIIKK